MRCPNCGNENPDDYTFCDECGAKLNTQEDSADANAGAGAASASADTSSGPVSDASASAGAGAATCPNCGAPVVPGEAYCSECGAELPANAATDDAGGAPSPQPYTPEASAEPASTASSQEEVPVTEDTVEAPPMTAEEPAPMPGVAPIAEEEGAPSPGAMPAEEPVAVPAVAASSAGSSSAMAIEHVEWANDALEQLDTAQQAMARGDFVGYGQAMSTLKNFLEGIAQGTGGGGGGQGQAAASASAPAAVAYAPASEAGSAATSQPASTATPAPAEPASEDGVQAAAPVAAAAASPSAGSMAGTARLVVISSGAELPLPQQEEITVGREDPSSGIFPDIDLTPYGGEDGGVSRRHARLLHVSGDYFVEDLQSTNYTKVDGQRLPARVREKLEDGARLDFGRVAMIFRRS